MTFARKLKTLRKQQGLTQAQLAEKAELSRRTINHYENGFSVPNRAIILEKLAKALEIEKSFLLDDVEEEFIKQAKKKYGARGAAEAEQLLAEVSGLFAGGEMADADMDEMMRAIQDAYWIAKQKNREKSAHAEKSQT